MSFVSENISHGNILVLLVNSFDPTPRLKSSPVPVLFLPFKNSEKKCNYCGNEYSVTLEFRQKYCKNCLHDQRLNIIRIIDNIEETAIV